MRVQEGGTDKSHHHPLPDSLLHTILATTRSSVIAVTVTQMNNVVSLDLINSASNACMADQALAA